MLAQKRANLKGEVEHAAALVDAERCMAAKAVAEEELEQAAPALNHAVLLLNALRASDVAEVRALKNPPQSVKLVLEAVCVMKDVKPEKVADPKGGPKKVDDYFGPAKKMMMDAKAFVEALKAYDKVRAASGARQPTRRPERAFLCSRNRI